MEKRIISILISIIIVFISVSGCLDMNSDDGILLEFTSSECDLNPYNNSELGVKNVTWKDNSTLQINAVVSIICNFKIKSGDYRIKDTNVTLLCDIYNPTPGGFAECLCTFELTYVFYNITEQDYEIGFGQTSKEYTVHWGQPWP